MPVGRNPVPVILSINGSCFRINSEAELDTRTQFVSLRRKKEKRKIIYTVKFNQNPNIYLWMCSLRSLLLATCGTNPVKVLIAASHVTKSLCSSNTRERKFCRLSGVQSWKIRLQMTSIRCHKRVRHTQHGALSRYASRNRASYLTPFLWFGINPNTPHNKR